MGQGEKGCWEDIPGFSIHLSKGDGKGGFTSCSPIVLSCCHGNTRSNSGRNGYFWLFNQGGGNSLVF